MTEDVDMDAPQISTLREDNSPEPQPAPKVRLKLLVSDKGQGSKAGSTSSKHARADSEDDEEDEDEDEEDQLIDDDDEELPKPAPAPPPPVAAPARGSPAKRGSRGRGGGRRGRGGRGAAAAPGPGVGVFETLPSESTSAQEPRAEVWDPLAAERSFTQSIPGMPVKKKPGPPKGAAAQRAIRKKPSKAAKGAASLLKDDADSVSEAYAGTAPSSPTPHDGSPEPDIPLSSLLGPPVDDAPLDGVPLPVYPLPSRPFPVQPPPKIGTGFAPVIPLDKSGKPVRRWRQVNREVRGIAGGRWFVKSWVGEKESEFATALAASQAAAQSAAGDGASTPGLTLPKLPSVSGTGRGRGRGGRIMHDSSRAGSAFPDSLSAQLARKRASGPGTPSVETPPVAISAPPAPQ
ncbi:hypothetical protein PYCCODRAFT_1475020 [Trametes coccinea BRFM310]|uniref:Uncharacterized protein n=1 Tax=Trametes coccinea (strain BRFM310) TaxID=1353009 RepID=A0A1Y2IZT7_TRAC3|nr:hypothetical protein PYCCODRAFT_1475020 [Trametes coccinea BRFM310]